MDASGLDTADRWCMLAFFTASGCPVRLCSVISAALRVGWPLGASHNRVWHTGAIWGLLRAAQCVPGLRNTLYASATTAKQHSLPPAKRVCRGAAIGGAEHGEAGGEEKSDHVACSAASTTPRGRVQRRACMAVVAVYSTARIRHARSAQQDPETAVFVLRYCRGRCRRWAAIVLQIWRARNRGFWLSAAELAQAPLVDAHAHAHAHHAARTAWGFRA